MKKVVVVDYGMGNIDSVVRAVEECGASAVVSCDPRDFAEAASIILPGVGAFGDGMRNIRERGLDKVLREQVLERGIPFLGICLGMQLLAGRSSEGGDNEGLGWIKAEVTRLVPDKHDTKVPHMGWNEVNFTRPSLIFQDIPSGKDFYFVHSYRMVCEDGDDVAATTPYCGGFTSSVCKRNIFGVQFHPEKSQKTGKKLLSNFLKL